MSTKQQTLELLYFSSDFGLVSRKTACVLKMFAGFRQNTSNFITIYRFKKTYRDLLTKKAKHIEFSLSRYTGLKKNGLDVSDHNWKHAYYPFDCGVKKSAIYVYYKTIQYVISDMSMDEEETNNFVVSNLWLVKMFQKEKQFKTNK